MPPIDGPAFLNAMVGSRLVLLEKSGYLPMLEEGEIFARLTRDFLVGD